MIIATLKTGFPSLKSSRSALALASIAIVLQACGGGGGGDNDAPDITPDTNTPETSIPDTPVGSINPGLNSAPADVAGGPYLQNSNNSAILTGPVFGSGEKLNSALVKSVPFSTEKSAPGLEIIEMRVVDKTSGPAKASSLIGIIKNNSDRFDCKVGLEDVDILTESGARMDSGDLGGLIEGVPGSSDNLVTSSCVGPGSLAYFKETSTMTPFEDVAEVRIKEIEVFSTDSVPADASVMPLSYTVNADGTIAITVVNGHSEQIEISTINVFALDENGHALTWDLDFMSENIEPGQEIVTDDLFSLFEGQASSMRVIVDYDFPDE